MRTPYILSKCINLSVEKPHHSYGYDYVFRLDLAKLYLKSYAASSKLIGIKP